MVASIQPSRYIPVEQQGRACVPICNLYSGIHVDIKQRVYQGSYIGRSMERDRYVQPAEERSRETDEQVDRRRD